jgi:superfamily II DNA or RNA helicase
MMVNLTEIQERNNLIVDIIKEVFATSPSRHLVLISNFVDHLITLKELLDPLFPDQVGLYIGSSLKKLTCTQKEELESKQILLATTKIMEEGVDIKALDTIILATPKKKVVQSCGRILRRLKHEYENIPLMIDIVDQIGMFNGMARKRMAQYKEKYLISEGSSLEYYKYSNETQFKIKYEYTANLQSLRANKKEDSIKLENEKKINYSKMFDSDSDSDSD